MITSNYFILTHRRAIASFLFLDRYVSPRHASRHTWLDTAGRNVCQAVGARFSERVLADTRLLFPNFDVTVWYTLSVPCLATFKDIVRDPSRRFRTEGARQNLSRSASGCCGSRCIVDGGLSKIVDHDFNVVDVPRRNVHQMGPLSQARRVIIQ